jgi:hypothetical protein
MAALSKSEIVGNDLAGSAVVYPDRPRICEILAKPGLNSSIWPHNSQVLVLSVISAILTPEKVFSKTLRSKSG